ncbi:unnamed protein product, partial [Staurois parvus]
MPHISAYQCTSMPHQCPSDLPFSASRQCRLSVPVIAAYECCLSVPISDACHSPSVPPVSA